MAIGRDLAKNGLEALQKAGAEKAQCRVTLTQKHEMNVEVGEFSLLRTTLDTQVNMTAITGGRKGMGRVNKSSDDALLDAAEKAVATARSSEVDDANDIAERQPSGKFFVGADSPDLEAMHRRMKELLASARQKYPKVGLSQVILTFVREEEHLVNSNGVDFETGQGVYQFMALFFGKDQGRVSSFNYTAFSLKDLEAELLRIGTLDTLLKQSEEQFTTTPLKGKFVGDVIITPDCVGDVLGFLVNSISDGALISGTSIYKESVGKQVASPLLTIHSRPVSDEIGDGYFLTNDGYAAQNSTLVEGGVLKSLLLSLYGSKKTGRPKAVNQGQAWVIDAGETSLESMIGSVKRGILLSRFSGGMPSDNGDFSGVAKNSYLIEDGKVRYPVSESMVSGNFAEMFMNINAVSSERADFGFAILPWIKASGVTVSGK